MSTGGGDGTAVQATVDKRKQSPAEAATKKERAAAARRARMRANKERKRQLRLEREAKDEEDRSLVFEQMMHRLAQAQQQDELVDFAGVRAGSRSIRTDWLPAEAWLQLGESTSVYDLSRLPYLTTLLCPTPTVLLRKYIAELQRATPRQATACEGETLASARLEPSIDRGLASVLAECNITQDIRRLRHGVTSAVRLLVARIDKDARVEVFGSTSNNLVRTCGDVDMVLLKSKPFDHDDQSRWAALLGKAMRARPKDFTQVTPICHSRVPIVKFRHVPSGLEGDVSFGNYLSVRNSQYIAAMMSLDDRVRPLLLLVKYWARCRKINDASQSTISSYAWVLLMLSFLQHVEVLPPLQTLVGDGDRVPQEDPSRRFDWYYLDAQRFRAAGGAALMLARNQSSVAVLFAQFFVWLSNFPTTTHTVSVRCGKPVAKEHKLWGMLLPRRFQRTRLAYLSIEDPFDVTHDLCRVLQDDTFLLIRFEVLRARALLCGDDGDDQGDADPWEQLMHGTRGLPDDVIAASVVASWRDKVRDLVDTMIQDAARDSRH